LQKLAERKAEMASLLHESHAAGIHPLSGKPSAAAGEAMTFDIAPLPGQDSFGAVVTGLAIESVDDPAVADALRQLWIDKGLIIFRGIEGLDAQVRLSRLFGTPVEHSLSEGAGWHPPHPLVTDIEYDDTTGEGDLYEIGGELRGAWLPWHSDAVFVAEINHGGILRPVELPAGDGGRTGFIDQIAAYEALPERLRVRIEGLNVLYRYDTDSSRAKYGQRADRLIRLSEKMRMAARHKAVRARSIHPMVYTQAETGRKVLNISPWWADAIEGMENEEGDALLKEVIDHCIDPARAYFHQWAMDDMVLWDNWRLIHCACGVPAGSRRHMHRTTIIGDYGLGRFEVPAASLAS
jgi:taurine dioxygenase